MSNKSKTKTQEQSQVTPTNPAFVTNSVKGLQNQIDQFARRDPREFVAPASPLQQQAFGMGQGLANRMAQGSTLDFNNIQIGGDNVSGVPGLVSLDQSGSFGFSPQQPGMNPFPLGQSQSPAQSLAQPQVGGGQIGNVNTGEITATPATTQPVGQPEPAQVGPVTASPFGAMQAEVPQTYGDLYLDVAREAQRPMGFGFRNDGVPLIDAPLSLPNPLTMQAQPIEQRDPVTGAAIGQVDAIAPGGPNPADFFTGAGLLAGNAGLAGANVVGGVARSDADTLGPAMGYQAQGPATVATYNAAGPAPVFAGNAATLGDAQGYDAPSAQAVNANFTGYNPAFGNAAAAGAQGFDPVTASAVMAGARGYDAAQAQLQQYQAALADLENLPQARASGASAARIRQDRIDALRNPYEDAVVDATLADFDANAERTRAQQAAQAAGAGAFGGSRFGVREAVTEGELARARASQQAGLLADSYNFAAGLANEDAGRQQQANITNAQLGTQASLANADMGMRGILANMGALNEAGQFNADAFNRTSLANAGMTNDARAFSADAGNRASLQNAQLGTSVNLANSDAINNALQFTAAANNQAGLANAGFAQQMNLANMDAFNQAGQFNADAFNRVGLQDAQLGTSVNLNNAGLLADALQFEAGANNQFDLADQEALNRFGLANMDAFNRSALDFAGRSDAAGQFGADAFNRSFLDYAGRADSAGQFNAGEANRFGLAQFDANNQANFRNADALNNMSQFNAGQRDNMLARQLQAAGLLGDLGATIGAEDRANIGLLAGLGNDQREIDREFRNAEPTMLQLLAALQAQQPYGLFRGENSSGSSTSTTKDTGPAVWNQAMSAVGKGAEAAATLLFSDERLKRDITPAGRDAKGRQWFEFNYVWGGPRQFGVIAQDVVKTDPQAVARDPITGFLTVDYRAIQ